MEKLLKSSNFQAMLKGITLDGAHLSAVFATDTLLFLEAGDLNAWKDKHHSDLRDQNHIVIQKNREK